MTELKHIILYLSFASHLIPLVAGRKSRPSLWKLAAISLVTDLTAFFLKLAAYDISWMVNPFFFTEFAFYSIYYRDRIFQSGRQFYLFTGVITGLFLVSCYKIGLLGFNGLGSAVFFLVYILYSACGFYKMLNEKQVIYVERSSFFWINTGLLVYACGNILLFLFGDYMVRHDMQLMAFMWAFFHNVLTIIMNVFLAIAFTKIQKYES